jgi:cache domain-containing protein
MSHRLHGINYRVFTTLLVIGLAVLVLASFLVLEDGRAKLRDAFGLKLSQRAEQSASAIDAYVYRRIVDVSTLARVPDVRAESVRANLRPVVPGQAAEMDRAFAALDVKRPGVAAILSTPASKYFADITRQDPIYREILLTDRAGRLVSASNVTSDYDQSDEDWWKRVMADPTRGEATLSDVRWDDSARIYAMEIAVPVPGMDERPAGVLKVVADIREMLASVAGMDVGSGGDAMLVRRNGTIVFSRQTVQPSTRFFGADRMKERLDLSEGSGPSRLFFTADAADGVHQIVGVGTSQLSSTYPHLPWVVVAWQPESELLAPVQSLYRSLLLALAFTAICVIGLAFWFSLKLAKSSMGIDMALVPHPPIQRVAEEESV